MPPPVVIERLRYVFPGARGTPPTVALDCLTTRIEPGIITGLVGPDAAGKVVYFMSIEGAKFRRPVVPGDQVRFHVVKERNRGNVWKFHAVARVDGVAVAEATYAAMIMDRAPGP